MRFGSLRDHGSWSRTSVMSHQYSVEFPGYLIRRAPTTNAVREGDARPSEGRRRAAECGPSVKWFDESNERRTIRSGRPWSLP